MAVVMHFNQGNIYHFTLTRVAKLIELINYLTKEREEGYSYKVSPTHSAEFFLKLSLIIFRKNRLYKKKYFLPIISDTGLKMYKRGNISARPGVKITFRP